MSINTNVLANLAADFDLFVSGNDKALNAEQRAASRIINLLLDGYTVGEPSDADFVTYNCMHLVMHGARFLNRGPDEDAAKALKSAFLRDTTDHIKFAKPKGKVETFGPREANTETNAKAGKAFLSRAFDVAAVLAYIEDMGHLVVWNDKASHFSLVSTAFCGPKNSDGKPSHRFLLRDDESSIILNNKSAFIMGYVKVDKDGKRSEAAKSFRASFSSLVEIWRKPTGNNNRGNKGITLAQVNEYLNGVAAQTAPLSAEMLNGLNTALNTLNKIINDNRAREQDTVRSDALNVKNAQAQGDKATVKKSA